MRLYMVKVTRNRATGLIPVDDDGRDVLRKLGDGEVAEFKILRPRNLSWHRKYYGICRTIGENQDPQRDEDSIDNELRIRAGHYDVMLVDEHEVRVPKRIAFDKLTTDEWEKLWPSLELAIRERFGNEYMGDTF